MRFAPRLLGTLVAVLVLTVARVAAQPIPSPTPAKPLDPVAIYERCVAAMNAEPRPPYAIYSLRIEAHHLDIARSWTSSGASTTILSFGSWHHTSRFRVWYRTRDQHALTQDLIAKTETLEPPVPWALDLTPPPGGIPNASDENVSGEAAAIAQATILLSQVYVDEKAAYHISLGGTEEYNGHRVYELDLENVGGDPNDHPLRALLVDAASFRPRQVTIDVGERTMLFGGELTMTASFDQVGAYWLSTNGSIVGSGHFTFIHVHGTYTYEASDFLFPAQLPESTFSAAQPSAPST
jgi:hypothetical protein